MSIPDEARLPGNRCPPSRDLPSSAYYIFVHDSRIFLKMEKTVIFVNDINKVTEFGCFSTYVGVFTSILVSSILHI